jgi:outer membrane protein TolC
MTLFKLRDAERKIDLYGQTLMPKAIQSMTATEAAFRLGTATFLDVVDAQRILLEFHLSHERALVDFAQSLAKLEMLVGRPLGASARPIVNKGTEVREDGGADR